MPTRLDRKLDKASASARQAMATFRENRRLMGFSHTSAYVPEVLKPEFQRFVEKLKAEYMLSLLELPSTSPERNALAQCNYVNVPEPSEVHFRTNSTKDVTIRQLAKELLKQLEQYQVARSALRNIESVDEEVVNFASRAVAHNAMAAYLWQELETELENASPLKGRQEENERSAERSEAG